MDILADVLFPIFRETVISLLPLLPYAVLLICVAFVAFLIKVHFYKKSTYHRITHNTYLSVRFDLGKYGEYLIYKELRHLEKEGAKFLFNAYIPKEDGSTTEIDVLMICPKGVFVFESKNYSGWIFGNEKQPKWTQTLPRGRGKSHKEQFLNPIIQNKVHINHLCSLIGDDIPIYSVIVFSDRCTLKDITTDSADIPVINRHNITSTVIQVCEHTSECLAKDTVNEIYDKLYPFTQVDIKVKADHIAKIHEKTTAQKQPDVIVTDTAKPTPDGIPKCPRCGSDLVLRCTKRGEKAGKQFYGCSAYPKCRYTKEP